MLKGKVIFITGATRGIGREIALRCAKEGARIVVTGKSQIPHPTLPGTLQSVAEEIRELGGEALECPLDVRDVAQIEKVVQKTVELWGGVDILINNASAIALQSVADISMDRFDLLMAVNMRATFACAKACIPALKQASNPHILTLSPPINMDPACFGPHLAYTLSKYGMSMCTLGLAEELRSAGIAVNSLWPKTLIATMAINVHFPQFLPYTRNPAIVADAAYWILTQPSRTLTGQFLLDENILRQQGVQDFSAYATDPTQPLQKDLFLE